MNGSSQDFLGPHTSAIVIAMFTLPLLYYCAGCIRSILRGYASRRWQRSQATILTDELKEKTHWPGPVWRTAVTYEFFVGASRYVGNRIFWGDDALFPFKRVAEWRVSIYTPGKEVPVFFDPKNPNRSVLEPGVDGLTWYFLAVYGSLAALGVVGWVKYAH